MKNKTEKYLGEEFYRELENIWGNNTTTEQKEINKNTYKNINIINNACISLVDDYIKQWGERNPELKNDSRKKETNINGFFYKTENIKEIDKQEDIALSKYQPFSFIKFARYGWDSKNKEYALDTEKRQQLINFCMVKKINFSIEQLLEIIFFFACFPIKDKDEKYWINIDKDKRAYDKYIMFYEYIVEPSFEKNKKIFKNKEECFVHIARQFNKTKNLYITYEEKLRFYREFEYNPDLPIEMYCIIKYGEEFFITNDKRIDYLEPKKEPENYLPVLEEYKAKIKEINF